MAKYLLVAGSHGDANGNYHPGDIVEDNNNDLTLLKNGREPRFLLIGSDGKPVNAEGKTVRVEEGKIIVVEDEDK